MNKIFDETEICKVQGTGIQSFSFIYRALKSVPNTMRRPFFMIPILLKQIKLKWSAHNKLISILIRFIAHKRRAFSLAPRLLNVDRYYFTIRIII